MDIECHDPKTQFNLKHMGNLLSRLDGWWYEFIYASHPTPLGRLWQRYVVHGTQEWVKDGVWHRDGEKPARISADGACEWWVEGVWHRGGDKPAVINGYRREWWVNGVRHRDGDKPATEGSRYGSYEELVWVRNGRLHRDGGKPAYVSSDGISEWWVYGTRIRASNRCPFAKNNQRFDFVAACLQF